MKRGKLTTGGPLCDYQIAAFILAKLFALRKWNAS